MSYEIDTPMIDTLTDSLNLVALSFLATLVHVQDHSAAFVTETSCFLLPLGVTEQRESNLIFCSVHQKREQAR